MINPGDGNALGVAHNTSLMVPEPPGVLFWSEPSSLKVQRGSVISHVRLPSRVNVAAFRRTLESDNMSKRRRVFMGISSSTGEAKSRAARYPPPSITGTVLTCDGSRCSPRLCTLPPPSAEDAVCAKSFSEPPTKNQGSGATGSGCMNLLLFDDAAFAFQFGDECGFSGGRRCGIWRPRVVRCL